MLPSVAHQPLQFLPHRHTQSIYSTNTPYDFHEQGIHSFQDDFQFSQYANHGPFSLIRGSRTHCPRPIQRPEIHSLPDGRLSGSSASQENTLRRKTPNGTLAAGYDATPGDRSIQQPATKHILVSSLDNSQIMPQPGLSLDPLQQFKTAEPLPLSQHQNFPPAFKQDTNRINTVHNGIPQEFPNTNWIRSLNPPQGGIDSVLNQTSSLPAGQRYNYWQNLPTVPTVLASSFQPGLGGPESAAAAQYGQYWPDGPYMPPYRPTTFGDTRYQSTPSLGQHSLPTNNRLADAQSLFNRQSLPPSEFLAPGFSWNPLPAQSTINAQQQHQVYAHDLSRPQQHYAPSHIPQKAPDQIWDQPQLQSTRGWIFRHKRHPAHRQFPSIDDSAQLRHLNQPFDHGMSSDMSMNGYRTIRRSHGASMSRMFSPAHEAMSISEKAVSALEMLGSLCKESGWTWIDGMLIGGCLAYGLGDYNRAMRWYNRVINQDSTHVEAISNLAASLLALERREEALQHWLRAIKLRPSYFDAVEHLIGLLCSSQRGKEAVNIVQYVENSLRLPPSGDYFKSNRACDQSDTESEDRESSVSTTESADKMAFDYTDSIQSPLAFARRGSDQSTPGFGSSGYAIPGADNGRILGLIHAKGNMLYALGDNVAAAGAFEEAILISTGKRRGMKSLIRHILSAFADDNRRGIPTCRPYDPKETVLLFPDKALQTAKLVFHPHGILPGLQFLGDGLAKRAAISTTSNSLLSLAKIYQDGMASTSSNGTLRSTPGVRDILALYYLSLSLQPSPSTANNVGILLAGIQGTSAKSVRTAGEYQIPDIPGVTPGSGIALALAYYNYGLTLDSRHAHLYTNLGSLLKDIGQLSVAIKMYELAVQCDNKFDIALANLANAVKDSGRINDAIGYYRRAVNANPDFAEAVCGLANALNSVCNWGGRGGISPGRGIRDLWHVDDQGRLRDAKEMTADTGWIKRVVDIVDKQLKDGELWGCGTLQNLTPDQLCLALMSPSSNTTDAMSRRTTLNSLLRSWSGKRWEGSRTVRLIERMVKYIGWQWYQDRYVHRREYPASRYARPNFPGALTPPSAPTVLPFHTFTCPLSAKQIRHISQRNGLRISCSTLRSPWLPATVYPPPAPPNPQIKVGYVSSDFNNHPLAHLMQSVFGLHNPSRVKAICYATTASDNSIHRQQIQREAPVFRDVSSWSVDRLVDQIVRDGVHILVNLNGYTRGARNEVFAARPAPIHMSFMGFAGSLGAEWSDYILADELSIPPSTLAPRGQSARIEDRLYDVDHNEDADDWIYNEKIVYTKHTFFCCDHRQSAPDARAPRLTWQEEQANRWKMRKELFPDLKDDTVILGNFNQLYKIEPTTFRTWLRILAGIPNAILWLLRFPDVGEYNLRQTAKAWAGEATASRIVFTDVAPKHTHISRARICDLFLDTPECNAHTTAADVLWSGTPLLTFPRYKYKMCSRMASSILTSALPQTEDGKQAARQLISSDEVEYEKTAIELGLGMKYELGNNQGSASGRLFELRKMLYLNRWESKLFDTRRWVNDLEEAYEKVWANWVQGEEKDIWL
ncbi:UDP-N-acetylglucosaminyltransferase [Trichophyton equinum CBS 127.97]|uniref:protein O-GlcNAc transferase n=1 Tax=Trichophyton equinum (strain ATCC MYA-4606 / CBS 127.97) TaxID=559882 RepID=F2PTI5_TRIEC|nr:UDP-N-acetylglucosaminyltransferase [Trichophyton equinum CBS 127.97]